MTSAPAAPASFVPTDDPAVIAAGLRRLGNDTNRVDQAVKEVIAACEEGFIDEQDARSIIASVLMTMDVIGTTLGKCQVEGRIIDEVADHVRAKIAGKLLTPGSKDFDFAIAKHHSACGWLRKHVSNIVIQAIRDVRRAERRTGTATDPAGYTLDSVAYDPEPGEDMAAQNERAALVDDFEAQRHGLRGRPRIRLAVEQASDLLGVPTALRPADHRDRAAVAKMLRNDPHLAYRSLETFAAVVLGDYDHEDVLTRDIDERVLALWDSFDAEQVERLLEADPRFATALAEYAVSPFARPSKKSIQKMRAAVAAAAGPKPGTRGQNRQDLRWRTLSAALVESWVDTECEPISDFTIASEDEQAAAKKGHVVSRSRWSVYLTQAVDYPGAPLGSTAEQVQDRLMDLAVDSLVSRDFNRMREERDFVVEVAAAGRPTLKLAEAV